MNAMTAPQKDGPRAWVRITRTLLLLIALAYMAGVIVGFVDAHQDADSGPWSAKAIAVLSTMGVLALGAMVQLLRDLFSLLAQIKELPRRERVTVRLLAGAIALGFAVGIAVGVSGIAHSGAPTISPPAAIVISVLLVTAVSWISWRWWRAIDEHERAAYVLGANISAHFMLAVGIVWWVLGLSGLVPPPDAIVLILGMCFVWTGVWFYHKFF